MVASTQKKIDLVLFHRLPLHIQYEVFKYGKELFVRDEDYLLELKLPVLILMDEVLEYAVKAAGQRVGDSTLYAQSLAFMQFTFQLFYILILYILHFGKQYSV